LSMVSAMAVFSRPVRTEISFTISDFVMILCCKTNTYGRDLHH